MFYDSYNGSCNIVNILMTVINDYIDINYVYYKQSLTILLYHVYSNNINHLTINYYILLYAITYSTI